MRKAILFLLLTTILLTSTAFAAITVTDVNVTCAPTNPANGNCYTDSTYTIRYKLTDSNVLPPSGDVTSLADGNQSHWKVFINYGYNGNCKTSGELTVVGDTNVRAANNCYADIYSKDNNFNLGRNCVAIINPIKAVANGSWCFDVNVATYTAATAANGKYNADGNGTGTFTVNNALVSDSTNSIVAVIGVVLVAVAILIIVGSLLAIRQGANVLPFLPALIGLIIALMVIGALTLLLTGTA